MDIDKVDNIEDSLENLITIKYVNGDNKIFCEKCNKKKDAFQEITFQTLPRHLVFICNRFKFNIETLSYDKINTYFNFPENLDMNFYTEYYLKLNKKANNNYSLKSIIIHKGTTVSGHYYIYKKYK